MSDFDKEAEREKLREKYERDKAEREATQRMSDLLLKGATMTNSHCGTCGDPLFQQDGTTFCPSCHGNPDAVQGTDLEAHPAEESTARDADEDEGEDRDRPQPEIDGTRSATAENGPETEPERAGQTADADPAGDSSDRPASPPSEPTADREVRTQSEDAPSRGAETERPQSDRHHADSSRRPSGSRSGRTSGSRADDLEDARASLVAALEKFTREAGETDDPRYARECLEAAREAGETLETLR